MNGVLVIDKPAGLTSHDVVNRVRRILGERSVGHLGTLDPMATGVLPLVVGKFTRLAQFYTGAEKTYEGVIRFGFATATYDAEGEPLGSPEDVQVSLEDLHSLAGKFNGVITQTPPPFSAKKIRGVPAYKLARKKQEIDLQPVLVEVKEFVILGVSRELPDLLADKTLAAAFGAGIGEMQKGSFVYFRARVASGTYMRSIAQDMGVALGCGAHLAALRRTQVAEFVVPGAVTLGALQYAADEARLDDTFVHPRRILPHMPSLSATDAEVARIRNGQAVNLPDYSQARLVKVFAGQRELVAIARRVAGTLFHPQLVLMT
jgi:tRNA pseudouridine55 synthase